MEMANKNDLLGRLNSDLKNLLESTEIASLFWTKISACEALQRV